MFIPSSNVLIYFLTSLVTQSLFNNAKFNNVLLSLHGFMYFRWFLSLLISSFVAMWSDRMQIVALIFLLFIETIFVYQFVVSFRVYPYTVAKNVYSVVFGLDIL